MRLVIFCLAICLAATRLAAREIYVNNVFGSDLFDGSRPTTEVGAGGPTRTIAKALRQARAGDRVLVANTQVAYRESVSLTGSRHSGSETSAFVIDGGGATLEGSGPLPPDGWTHTVGDVFSCRPARLGHQQLFIDAKLLVRHPARTDQIGLPPLEPLQWCLHSGRVYFRVEAGHLPQDYQIGCCALQTGITLEHVADVEVRNFVVQGFAVDGVCAHDVARDVRLMDLECRANGRSGITVAGASRVQIRRCRLGSNGAAQLRCEAPARAQVERTELSADTAAALVLEGGRVTFDGPPMIPAK